jgi:hypothetical protein
MTGPSVRCRPVGCACGVDDDEADDGVIAAPYVVVGAEGEPVGRPLPVAVAPGQAAAHAGLRRGITIVILEG